MKLNAQMYDTGLTDAVSANILNEVQNVFVTSAITYESFVIIFLFLICIHDSCVRNYSFYNILKKISYDGFAAASSNDTIGVQEVQEISITNALNNDLPFTLKFDGVDTGKK